MVLVKQPYQGKSKPGVNPHRITVKLGMDGEYDGIGELTVNHDDIRVFEKEDDKGEKAFPWKIEADDLKSGKTVWVEGKKPSGAVGGTELKLTHLHTRARWLKKLKEGVEAFAAAEEKPAAPFFLREGGRYITSSVK